METAEQATATLHRNIKPELNRLGHRETEIIPESVRQFGVDFGKYTGDTVGELVGGVSTPSRETHSRNPLKIAVQRARQLLGQKK